MQLNLIDPAEGWIPRPLTYWQWLGLQFLGR